MFADQFGLGLLRLGKLGLAVFENGLKFVELVRLLVQIERQGMARFLGFFGSDCCSLLLKLRRYLLIDLRLGFCDGGLLFPNGGFALADLGLHLGELLLELAARGFQQRRR